MGAQISKNGLTEQDLDLLSETSKKPKEEVLFWYEHFLKECPTGKMNREQFVKYYKMFRKNENVEAIAKHCFAAFDSDKNGFVDFGEFMIAYVATNSTDPREKLKYAFEMYDLDNNKVLDEHEIKQVVRSMFKLLAVDEQNVNFDRCIENIMSSLDVDNDSKITKSEFIEGILSDSYLNTLLSPFQ
jgi:Ca2+-binding EF-hand superfamily protein